MLDAKPMTNAELADHYRKLWLDGEVELSRLRSEMKAFEETALVRRIAELRRDLAEANARADAAYEDAKNHLRVTMRIHPDAPDPWADVPSDYRVGGDGTLELTPEAEAGA